MEIKRFEDSWKSKIYHQVVILINIGIFISGFVDVGFWRLLVIYSKYLTCWGVIMSFIYFIMQYYKLGSVQTRQDLLVTLLCLETVITLIYWSVLHVIKPTFSNLLIFRIYVNHILPMAFLFFEFLRVRNQIYNYQIKQLILINFLYLFTNLAFTFGTGEPVYDIVTWDNLFSIGFACVTIVLMGLSFCFWKQVASIIYKRQKHI